ncbi:MAG: DUF2207 domain-containing protein [Planctomycetota bacterium]|jgi:uncharacterized membrane protein YgcG
MWKRALLVAVSLLCFAAEEAHARSLVVQDFHSEITVDEKGVVRVEERIQVDFRGSYNGIYRDIPYGYTFPSGVRGKIRLEVTAVEDDAGTALTYWEKRRGGFVKLKIKVPGANNAVRTIVIRYRAENVVRQYDESDSDFGLHDQLYWNVTGDGWLTTIEHASARVHLPVSVPASTIRATAYTGGYGMKGQQFRSEIGEGNVVFFETTQALPPHAGLTIVVGFEVGHVEHPSFLRKVWWIVEANWYVVIPLLLLLLWFFVWHRLGRDALEGRTIIPEWDAPMGLRAAEVGVLVDDKMDRRDVTAAIVDLAVRGVLKIHETEKSFRLELLPKGREKAQLERYEDRLLDGLFTGDETEVSLTSLNRKFYKKIPGIRRRILDDLVGKGFFPKAPDTTVQKWVAFTILALVGAGILGAVAHFPWTYFVAVSLCAIPMFVFAVHMPRRTRKGLDALARIRGIEEYLSTAEEERMKQMPLSHFETLLPFAVALDLHERWAKAFAGLFEEPPEWLDTGGRAWTRAHMWTVFDSMNRSVSSSLYSQPRSSSTGKGWGGGFSGGGGFGGGGGGGW